MKGGWVKNFFKIICIIILFVCIATTNGKIRNVTLIESVLNDFIALPQRAYTYIKQYVTGNDLFFSEVENLKTENNELKEKVKNLEEKVADYEKVNAENQVLKSHVNLSDKYPDYNVVVADIISKSNTNWEAIYVINKGSNDGIKAGMTVIAEAGLFGYVETVTKNTSKIISVLDAGNAVSARVTRTRDEVVCKGSISLLDKQELKVINIPTGTVLVEGDKLETSGMGGIYPKGIGIGKVVEVLNKKNPIENEAILKMYVDFDKVETLAVIVTNDDESTKTTDTKGDS